MHVTPYEIEHRLCEIRIQAYTYQVNVWFRSALYDRRDNENNLDFLITRQWIN